MKLMIIIFMMICGYSYSQSNSYDLCIAFLNIKDQAKYISSKELEIVGFDSVLTVQKINYNEADNFYLVKQIGVDSLLSSNAYIIEKKDKFLIFNTDNIQSKKTIDNQLVTVSVYEKFTKNITVFRVLDKQITSISSFYKNINTGWTVNNYYLNDNSKNNQSINIETVLSYVENYAIYASTFLNLHKFYKMELGNDSNFEYINSIIW